MSRAAGWDWKCGVGSRVEGIGVVGRMGPDKQGVESAGDELVVVVSWRGEDDCTRAV